MIKKEKEKHGIIDEKNTEFSDRFENPIDSINYVLNTEKLDEYKEKLIRKIKYDRGGWFYKKFDGIKYWLNCKQGKQTEKLDIENLKNDIEQI